MNDLMSQIRLAQKEAQDKLDAEAERVRLATLAEEKKRRDADNRIRKSWPGTEVPKIQAMLLEAAKKNEKTFVIRDFEGVKWHPDYRDADTMDKLLKSLFPEELKPKYKISRWEDTTTEREGHVYTDYYMSFDLK